MKKVAYETNTYSISGFCSVKQMRVFDSPWMGHYSITGCWYSFTYPGRMESGKRMHQFANFGRAWD